MTREPDSELGGGRVLPEPPGASVCEAVVVARAPEAAEATAAQLREHRLASAGGTLAGCALLVAVRLLRSALLNGADDVTCSNFSEACLCGADRADEVPHSGRARALRAAVGVLVLGVGMGSFLRLLVSTLGAPASKWRTRALFIGGPAAMYVAFTYVSLLWSVAMTAFAMFILLTGMQWHCGGRGAKGVSTRRSLRAVLPIWAIPLLSVVFTAMYYVLTPMLLEGSALWVLAALGLLRTAWSLALVRVINRLLHNNWKPAQQSLLLRLLSASGSVGRVGSSLLVAKRRGDMVTSTFVAGLCLYVAIQLVLRQNGLTVLRGRYAYRRSDAQILRRQSMVLAMYGSVRDWRFICYPVLALMHALNADGMQLFLTDCDGEVHADDFFPAWHFLALMLASDVVLEVLLHLSQRWLRRRNPHTPFRSAEFVAPPRETFLQAVYQVFSAVIGGAAMLTLL